MKTVQRYVENNTRSPMYVGNTMIPPGEGKVVDVPEPAAAAPATPAAPSIEPQLAELLDHPIKEIEPQLPGLTNEALDLLEQLEQGGKTRSTLIAAIQAERIRRADAKLQAGEAAQREQALDAARGTLLQARVALTNLPPTATEQERQAAEATVAEAQAQVDALEHPEG